MYHAVLVIAHKNVEQLIRLIKSLNDDKIDVYVHLDRKWNICQKDIDRIKSATNHVTVIDKRISGFLDTWSLCQIAIELIKSALRVDGNYSYFILLSGQDYPIKSLVYIKQYLRQQYPKPIIDCTPMTKDNWIFSGFKWIRFHWYYRMIEGIIQNKRLRKIMLLPVYAVQIIVTIILRSPYMRLKKTGCKLYGGSAWWILPREVVQKCVDEVDENTKIVKAFKLKNTPEETFFQTLTMRTKYANLVELNDPYEVLQNCMTYAYFFDEEHVPTGHPYILTANNYEMLMKRKELFARKFDTNVDAEVLDMLDNQMTRTI